MGSAWGQGICIVVDMGWEAVLNPPSYIWLVLVCMGPERSCKGMALEMGRHRLVRKVLGSLSIVHMCGGCLRDTLRGRSPERSMKLIKYNVQQTKQLFTSSTSMYSVSHLEGRRIIEGEKRGDKNELCPGFRIFTVWLATDVSGRCQL